MPPKKNPSSTKKENEINLKTFFSLSPRVSPSPASNKSSDTHVSQCSEEIKNQNSPSSDSQSNAPLAESADAPSQIMCSPVVDLNQAFQAVASSQSSPLVADLAYLTNKIPNGGIASSPSKAVVPKAYSKRKSDTSLEESAKAKSKKEMPSSSPSPTSVKPEKDKSPTQPPLPPEYEVIHERIKRELGDILRETFELVQSTEFEQDVNADIENFRKEFPDIQSLISEPEFPKKYRPLLCLLVQDSDSPLSQLVQQVGAKLFGSLADLDTASFSQFIASNICIIANRVSYGVKEKKSDEKEDTSPNSCWLWECEKAALPPKLKSKLELLKKARDRKKKRVSAHKNVLLEFEKKNPSASKIDEAMKKVDAIADEIKQQEQKELELLKKKLLKEEAALAAKVSFINIFCYYYCCTLNLLIQAAKEKEQKEKEELKEKEKREKEKAQEKERNSQKSVFSFFAKPSIPSDSASPTEMVLLEFTFRLN